MGGDDFSAFQAEAPGCYAFIGAGGEYPHHHPRFVIDERALAIGTRLHVQVAPSARGVRMKLEPIAVDEAVLEDLRRRLDATRWPDEPPDAGPEHGLGLVGGARAGRVLARRLRLARGRGGAELLRSPGIAEGVHFLADGEGPPLVLLHGWPSSVWEFARLMPLLREHARVIVPSLPGYRYSFTPGQSGASIVDCADAHPRG